MDHAKWELHGNILILGDYPRVRYHDPEDGGDVSAWAQKGGSLGWIPKVDFLYTIMKGIDLFFRARYFHDSWCFLRCVLRSSLPEMIQLDPWWGFGFCSATGLCPYCL